MPAWKKALLSKKNTEILVRIYVTNLCKWPGNANGKLKNRFFSLFETFLSLWPYWSVYSKLMKELCWFDEINWYRIVWRT